jgi:hypothetical protein
MCVRMLTLNGRGHLLDLVTGKTFLGTGELLSYEDDKSPFILRYPYYSTHNLEIF